MKTVGMIIKCDRCPKEIFVKRVSCSLNFGMAAIEKFEDSPKGWTVVPGKYNGDRNLCPECSKKYDEMHSSFWYDSEKRTFEAFEKTVISKTVSDWAKSQGISGGIEL